MAADEQEPQDVVAVVGVVEPLGELGLGVVQVRDQPRPAAAARCLRAPAHAVERDVAPDQDEPGGGIARRAVARPGLQRAQAGVLERLLGGVEVAEIAQQRAERLGTRGGERGVDPGRRRSRRGRSPRPKQARAGGSHRRRRGWPRARSRATLERLLERRAVDDVEAEQLLLGLGERAVDDQRRSCPCAAWSPRWSASGARPARACPALASRCCTTAQLGHDRVVLLLGPGADDVFVMVAEDGIEHAARASSTSQGRTSTCLADRAAKKNSPAPQGRNDRSLRRQFNRAQARTKASW